MLARVIHAFAWRKLRSHLFDNHQFALIHAKVHSIIQRHA